MNPIYNKIAGYVLLIIGLGIIFWSIYSSYNIFNGQQPAPEIFTIETKETPVSHSDLQINNQSDLENQIEDVVGNQIGKQLKDIMPPDFLPKMLNLASWSIFIGILIFAGSQISGLGIKLAKD